MSQSGQLYGRRWIGFLLALLLLGMAAAWVASRPSARTWAMLPHSLALVYWENRVSPTVYWENTPVY